MTTSLKTWSAYASDDGTPLSESDKAYFRAKTRRHVHGVVLEKFMQHSDDDKLSRSALAHRLNVNRAQITRWLSSPGNWTLDTLSDLLLAMSCQASVIADEIGNQQKGNYAHPASMGRLLSTESEVKKIEPFTVDTTTIIHSGASSIFDLKRSSTSEAA